MSSPEVAQEFKAAFIKGQAEMTALLTGADSSASGEKGEEKSLTEAIDALHVKVSSIK